MVLYNYLNIIHWKPQTIFYVSVSDSCLSDKEVVFFVCFEEREREMKGDREREILNDLMGEEQREKERGNLKQAPHQARSLTQGLISQSHDHEIMTWAKIQSLMFDQLSQPDQSFFYSKKNWGQ